MSRRQRTTTSIHLGSTYTHRRHTQTHTVGHSEINTVRVTMIPLHYLHTGPPSCARLLHCPLHCFSVEVVITKANISFLCVSPVSLHFSVFSFVLCSALPVFLAIHTSPHTPKQWSVDRSPGVTPRAGRIFFGAERMLKWRHNVGPNVQLSHLGQTHPRVRFSQFKLTCFQNIYKKTAKNK